MAAEAEAAAAAEAAVPLPRPAREDGVERCGWRLSSSKGPISSEAERAELESRLGLSALPEMVFGGNRLRLEHEASGFSLSFETADALRGCRLGSDAGGGGGFRVTAASGGQWAERLRQHPDAQEIEVDYDWTFSTRYAGSDGGARARAEWKEDEEAQLDVPLLQRRDPILWSDEVYLYEDELHDNGVSLLTARVRVMPACFLVLVRHWLRVDGVLVRVRDCRVFHDFAARPARVLREFTERGATFEELRARGMPGEAKEYKEATPALVARLPLKSRVMEVASLFE